MAVAAYALRPGLAVDSTVVTAEFVWIGESLVVLSSEEADELRRELSEPPKNPRRRPSDAQVVNVNPEYL
jgi:hypothetical protein